MTNPTQESFNEGKMNVDMECSILKEKMTRAAEKCGTALQEYYTVAGNKGLEGKMRYMLKDLLYQKKEEAEYICEAIYEEANMHLAAAMKYGYKPDDLADLRAYINEYRDFLKIQQQMSMGKKEISEIFISR